jgi:hypothetical protein
MAYTYDDFVKAANQSGLMGQFSQDDLNLAQKYPEFGLSVLSLKKDYNNATTAEQRLLANQAANELRKSYGNYSGGADGGSFRLESKLNRRSDDLLDQLGSFGSFSYGEAPTYENTFAQQQKDLLDRILNREDFSWSKETDPQWSSYKKSYLREGDRATANALAQASAASGGRPSSHAVNAATQAGDYYATKLNDVIPTLYQQAYERYLDEYNMKLKDLNAVNQQEQLDYAKYLDRLGQFNTDRGFAYQNYADDYDRLRSQLADVQGQDQIDYARYLDEASRQQTAQDSIRSQVDAILAAGGSPSANLVSESGYSSEYVKALEDAYRKQGAEKAAKKSGSGGGGTMSLTTAKAMAKEGQFTDTVLNTLRKAGFTDDYIAQVYGYTGFGTGRDKLGYDEDEGIFTWNGRRYNSPEALAEDLDRANLTDTEKATISRRLKASGFNITF